MTLVHGKLTYVSIDDNDLSAYANNSQYEYAMDVHNVTTYGKNRHVFRGGLGNGTVTISGFYDSTAVTGPRAVLKPLAVSGATVPLAYRPEGTGSGLPQDVVDVIVTKYVETRPVDNMVTFSVDLQMSDDIDAAAQAA